MCQIFFDPRNEISMPNNPHYHSSKVSLVSLCCCPTFISANRWRFSVALQKSRPTAIKVKRRHLVAEMRTLQTDKPTKPSCPIKARQPLITNGTDDNIDVHGRTTESAGERFVVTWKAWSPVRTCSLRMPLLGADEII
jgi:hypothetical protein